jgi:hypothetical protein
VSSPIRAIINLSDHEHTNTTRKKRLDETLALTSLNSSGASWIFAGGVGGCGLQGGGVLSAARRATLGVRPVTQSSVAAVAGSRLPGGCTNGRKWSAAQWIENR